MIRAATRCAVIIFTAVLGGCNVSSDTVRLDGVMRSATDPNQIVRLTTPPNRPHKVIGRIQVGPDALVGDYEGQTDELVRLASELGADGVILEYSSRVGGYVSGDPTAIYGYAAESKFTVGEAFVWLAK